MNKNVNVLAMCLCLYLKYIIHTFSTISFKQIGRSPMFHLLIGHLLIFSVSITESIFNWESKRFIKNHVKRCNGIKLTTTCFYSHVASGEGKSVV